MSLKARIKRLESALQPPVVIGVRIDDGPVTVAGEALTVEAFEQKYPSGRLIQLCIVNRPSDESHRPAYRTAL